MCLWDVKSGQLLWKRPISFIQKADEYYTLTAIVWSFDQKWIATGSANGTIQLWDAQTGDFSWRADVGKGDVTAAAFSKNGKIIAAASDNGTTIKLIHTENGGLIEAFDGGLCTVQSIVFDEGFGKLRVGQQDGNISEWDLNSGKQINASAQPCRGIGLYGWETSFSSDLDIAVKRTSMSEVAILNTQNGKAIKSAKANNSNLHSAVSGTGERVIISEYGGFHLYDLKTGEDRMIDNCVGGA